MVSRMLLNVARIGTSIIAIMAGVQLISCVFEQVAFEQPLALEHIVTDTTLKLVQILGTFVIQNLVDVSTQAKVAKCTL